MKRLTKSALLALLALPACDRQADGEYQGDSLLRVKGSVTIPQGLEGAELVPVIGFNAFRTKFNDSGYYDALMDVGVDGNFPANFTLDVFDPPPAEAIKSMPGLVPRAYGYLTAMSPSHPTEVTSDSHTTSTGDWTHDLETETCERNSTSRCFKLNYSCDRDHDDVEQVATGPEECTLTSSSGDTSVSFAGYSKDLLVVYFPSSVPAGDFTAFQFGDGSAIAAGYHLYERKEMYTGPVSLPLPPPSACETEAKETCYEEYNTAHGTSWSEMNQPSNTEAESYELFAFCAQTAATLGCPMDNGLRALDPDESISIQLGAEQTLTSW